MADLFSYFIDQSHGRHLAGSENYGVMVCTNTILNDEITPLFIIYTLESLLLHILANFRQHSDN